MIEKPKLLMLVILLTLSGILGLYGYAVSIETKTVPISELEANIDNLVAVEGYVKDVTVWNDEAQILLIDYASEDIVTVIIEKNAWINVQQQEKFITGAKVMARGLVEKGHLDEMLIRVMSSEGIKLLEPARNIELSLSIILERPDVFKGMNLTVEGQVWDIEKIESISAYTFTLQNSSEGQYYSVNCIVFDSPRFIDIYNKPIYNGTNIIFKGVFEYYASNGIWQIKSNEGKDSLEKVD